MVCFSGLALDLCPSFIPSPEINTKNNLGEESVNFILKLTVHHEGMSGQELKQKPGG